MKLLFILAVCLSSGLFAKETTLLLIRHGETDWNAEQRVQGQANIPLNSKGLKQAQELSQAISKQHPDIGVIYSSDLDRAYKTAEETAQQFDLKIEKRPSLREIHNGEAEGLSYEEKKARFGPSYDEMRKKHPDRKERWKLFPAIPGGESYDQLIKRVMPELISIAKAHQGEKIAIFSHGRLIHTLMAEALDTEDLPPIPNCVVVNFRYDLENSEQPLKFVKIENLIKY